MEWKRRHCQWTCGKKWLRYFELDEMSLKAREINESQGDLLLRKTSLCLNGCTTAKHKHGRQNVNLLNHHELTSQYARLCKQKLSNSSSWTDQWFVNEVWTFSSNCWLILNMPVYGVGYIYIIIMREIIFFPRPDMRTDYENGGLNKRLYVVFGGNSRGWFNLIFSFMVMLWTLKSTLNKCSEFISLWKLGTRQ